MYSDDLGVVIIMRKRCSIQQGEKKITVDQSKVLKIDCIDCSVLFGPPGIGPQDYKFCQTMPLGEIPINVKLENLSTIRRHSITSHYIIPRIDNLPWRWFAVLAYNNEFYPSHALAAQNSNISYHFMRIIQQIYTHKKSSSTALQQAVIILVTTTIAIIFFFQRRKTLSTKTGFDTAFAKYEPVAMRTSWPRNGVTTDGEYNSYKEYGNWKKIYHNRFPYW